MYSFQFAIRGRSMHEKGKVYMQPQESKVGNVWKRSKLHFVAISNFVTGRKKIVTSSYYYLMHYS